MFDGKERFINLLVRSRNLVFCFGGFFSVYFFLLFYIMYMNLVSNFCLLFLDGKWDYSENSGSNQATALSVKHFFLRNVAECWPRFQIHSDKI